LSLAEIAKICKVSKRNGSAVIFATFPSWIYALMSTLSFEFLIIGPLQKLLVERSQAPAQ